MASFLYLLGCVSLAALTGREFKTRNRTSRVQLYLTLLFAMVFCGVFALLVTAANLAGGQYDLPAALAVLVLTGGAVFTIIRAARRFRAILYASGKQGFRTN